MTTKVKNAVKITASIIILAPTVVAALWWLFMVSATATSAKAGIDINTPAIAAIEHRVTKVEIRQEERHDVVMGEFKKIHDKLNEMK